MTAAVVRAAALRWLSLALLWWALAEGSLYGWPYGLVIVSLTTAVSLSLVRPRPGAVSVPRRVIGLLQLVGYFARGSLLGGIDVAQRALRRPVDLTPGTFPCQLRIPVGLPRIVVIDMMSLMPGTLCVALEGDLLWVHALDTSMPVTEQLAELEVRVGRVTGWSPPS